MGFLFWVNYLTTIKFGHNYLLPFCYWMSICCFFINVCYFTMFSFSIKPTPHRATSLQQNASNKMNRTITIPVYRRQRQIQITFYDKSWHSIIKEFYFMRQPNKFILQFHLLKWMKHLRSVYDFTVNNIGCVPECKSFVFPVSNVTFASHLNTGSRSTWTRFRKWVGVLNKSLLCNFFCKLM